MCAQNFKGILFPKTRRNRNLNSEPDTEMDKLPSVTPTKVTLVLLCVVKLKNQNLRLRFISPSFNFLFNDGRKVKAHMWFYFFYRMERQRLT